MACSFSLCSSGCLQSLTNPHFGRDSSGARTLPFREAISWRKSPMEAGSAALALHSGEAAGRSVSRSLRVQAVEESTSQDSAASASVIENASGGGDCRACGKAEILGGCNGEGRIQGGIGAVPGFGWWPIKAFRPCPAFIESGGRYRRIGQSLEEVAFGRKGTDDDRDISERLNR